MIAVGVVAGLLVTGCASEVAAAGGPASPLFFVSSSAGAPVSRTAASPTDGSPTGSVGSRSMSSPAGPTAGAACQLDQLRAQVSGPEGTGGPAEYRITITDLSGPCVLRGAPTFLLGVDADGTVQRLDPTPIGLDDEAGMTSGKPADLTQSASADVVLLTSIACPAADPQAPATQTFRSLRLGIGTGTLDVPFGQGPEPLDTSIALPCGVAMSDFYASIPGEYEATTPGPTDY